jgi:ATP-dependent Lon protease
VLDPEQNSQFRDHYLEVPFDLSKVMFITTANMLDTILPPLRDRMEILELAGYTEEEKLQIAKRHLIPKQMNEHGLQFGEHMVWDDDQAIMDIIRGYTREAGVRNLEREIATVCRKATRQFAEGRTEPVIVTSQQVKEYLGAPRWQYEEVMDRTSEPGVAVGLAWTPTGGEVLFVEATAMPGGRSLTLTGQLGDVMKESAQAALSYVRSHAIDIGIDVLNPLQANAKDMDAVRIKEKAGRKLALWGGVDTHEVLPGGTPDDVREEVKQKIAVLGKGGGYMLSADHNILTDVPPQNLVAMFEAAAEFGGY